MLRKTIGLALAGLAIAAPPALAKSHWNAQWKYATATASRSAGSCSINPGSHQGSLVVACNRGEQATLTYAFPIRSSSGPGSGSITGRPWCEASWWGYAHVGHSCRTSGTTLRVTVTVADDTAWLNSVNVGYYS